MKGIGPKFASRIVKEFGAETLNVIEEDPDSLIRVPGIGKVRVERIKKSWVEKKEIKNIIRVTELIDLKITDVNLEAGVIRCVNHDTERLIPMYPAAVKALCDYITLVRPQMILRPDEQSLFVNISGEHMSRQGFWKIIMHYQKLAGIEKDITPHTLRHSFAAHLLENGADIHAVRDMLGHRDISSMQVYSKLVDKKIKDVYNKAHPRA